jgi:hypothetical protein
MSAAVAERRQPLTEKQIATIMRLRPAERDPERFAELRARAMNDRTDDARYRRGYRAGGKWTHFNKKGLLDKYSLAELISARVAFPRGAQAYLVKLACAVDRYGHSGLQVPHGRVASWIGVSPRQVALMLDWLEAHGLVERLHDVEIHPEGFTDREGRLRRRAELPVLVLPGPVLDAMIRRAKLHRAGRRIRVVEVDARSSVAVLGSQTLRSDSVASSQSGLSDQTSKKACCYTLIHSSDLKALALDASFLVRPESTLEFWHRIFVANRTATRKTKERARKRARITEQEKPEDARRLTRRKGPGAQRAKRTTSAPRSASGRRSADQDGLRGGATCPQAGEPATSPADFAVGACRALLDDLLNERKRPETVVEGLRFVGDAAPAATESYETDDPLPFEGDAAAPEIPPPGGDSSTSTATGDVRRFDFVGLVNDLRDGRASPSRRCGGGDPPRLDPIPYDDDDLVESAIERHHAEFRAWADERIARSRRELAEYVAREQVQREEASRALTPTWGPRPHSAPCRCAACVAWARAVVAAPSRSPAPVSSLLRRDGTAAD